jgi:hypothetical protein
MSLLDNKASYSSSVGTLQTGYPPRTSFKTRQVTGCAPTRCYVPYSSGPHLPVKVGSDAVTCPMASDLTSQLRWAPTLSRVLWLRTLPPDQGGSRCCHASRGPQWAVGLRYIKKGLAGLFMQLGSRVSKARTHVPYAPNARAIMGL